MNQQRKSTVLFIASMLIFGTIGIFRRQIPLSSGMLAFIRGTLGGLFLLGFMAVKRKPLRGRLTGKTTLLLMLTGALIGINWILLFEAYNYTTVAVATLCYYMQPTIVVLLSPIFFREKLTVKQGICVAVAITGMVLVSGVMDGGAGNGDLQGILLGLGAAVFYSTVVILNKKLTGVEPYSKTTIQLLSAGMVMVPYLLLTGGYTGISCSLQTVLMLLVVGIVHTGIAYVIYFGTMEHLKAQSVALLSYIDPVSALIFSAVLLQEPMSIAAAIGAVMIIGSAIVSEKK